MRKRGERYFVILPILIVFCCLLLTGGSRLIACEEEQVVLPHPPSVLRSALCSAPVQQAETGCVHIRVSAGRLQSTAVPMIHHEPDTSVCSDANGNVLRKATYLHAVYQVFSLGDGFA